MNSPTIPLPSPQAVADPCPLASAPSLGQARISYLLISPSGVLYDDTLWWRWLLQILSRFGMHANGGALTSLWQHDYYDDVCCGECEFFDALRRFLASCGLPAGQIDEVCAAGRAHWDRLEVDLRSYPQTTRTLSELSRKGWRMGLLVHGPLSSGETRSQLERMGILGYFEHIVCSSDVDSALGDRPAWSNVLSQLDVPSRSIGYVAHDDRLLGPAKASGLTTMAYQCTQATADHHVGELRDLPSIAAPGRHFQAA